MIMDKAEEKGLILSTPPPQIEEGKDIIKDNPFYFTLHLILKYYFTKQTELYIMNFLSDVTKSEAEFKVFMIYIEYSIYVYNNYIKDEFRDVTNSEDLVFIIVAYVKKTYSENPKVLQPFIHSVNENQDQVISKFNTVKSAYEFKADALKKLGDLNRAIEYLEKSKQLEIEAKKYSELAMVILSELKGSFRKTIFSTDSSTTYFLKNIT